MILTCTKRDLTSLVDELEDWRGEGARLFLHGTTHKAHDGFIVLHWDQPVPERFRQKLREDEVVVDYFTLDRPLTTRTSTASTLLPPQL